VVVASAPARSALQLLLSPPRSLASHDEVGQMPVVAQQLPWHFEW
jgi:hypothetical protein